MLLLGRPLAGRVDNLLLEVNTVKLHRSEDDKHHERSMLAIVNFTISTLNQSVILIHS
jgi:hypothetical protein